MLSYEEVSIGSFLGRLEYLQNMLREKRPDYDSNFILSTIHSSKGLEYEEVYLMDVCDGVFPDKVVYSKKATPQEKKEFEEERRLFYVGMTRAKSVLHIFRLSEETSSFIREMTPAKVEKAEGVKPDSLKLPNRVKRQDEKRVEGTKQDQGKIRLKPNNTELYSVKSGSAQPDQTCLLYTSYRYPSITSTGKLLPHPSVPKEQTLQLYERSVRLRSNRHGQA